MKVMIAAGGTGGHVNPALAVAGEIKKQHPDAEICFVGTPDRIESKIVPAAGYPLKTIEISGFKRGFSPSDIKANIKTVTRLLKSSGAVKKIIKEFNPDVAVGFGGYVSGPVIRMAAKMGIPTAIHEQNAYPGVTNKALAEKVTEICGKYGTECILHNFADTALELAHPKIHLPLPVLREMSEEDKTKFRIIGSSCHSPEEAVEAESLGAAYITAGHVFATDCKKGLPPRGLDFLKAVCESVDIPVYAIGGISAENIDDVRKAGAAGGCIMSGLMSCPKEKLRVQIAEIRK